MCANKIIILLFSRDVTRDYSQRRFQLAQCSAATLLRHCFERWQHCSNIPTLCCAKNRRCESSPVTSPLWDYDGAGGNGHVQKAIGLMSKTATLHMRHAFVYIPLPPLHNYDVKWLKFRFTWERKRQGVKLDYNPCLDSGEVPSLQLQPISSLLLTNRVTWSLFFQRCFHGRRRGRIVRSHGLSHDSPCLSPRPLLSPGRGREAISHTFS